MVERANSDRVFLIYDKKFNHQETRSAVRKFVAHFKQELQNIFTQESLNEIVADSSYMPYYNNNPISNARLSNAVLKYSSLLTSNPQEEDPMECWNLTTLH